MARTATKRAQAQEGPASALPVCYACAMVEGKYLGALLLASGLMFGCGDDEADGAGSDDANGGMAGANAEPTSPSDDEESETETDASSQEVTAQCREGCQATLAADCPIGPVDQEACEADCMMLGQGECGDSYGVFQACAEGEEVTCGEIGIPVVEACAEEQEAFIACLNL